MNIFLKSNASNQEISEDNLVIGSAILNFCMLILDS